MRIASSSDGTGTPVARPTVCAGVLDIREVSCTPMWQDNPLAENDCLAGACRMSHALLISSKTRWVPTQLSIISCHVSMHQVVQLSHTLHGMPVCKPMPTSFPQTPLWPCHALRKGQLPPK